MVRNIGVDGTLEFISQRLRYEGFVLILDPITETIIGLL
jgi:hypothetical protein